MHYRYQNANLKHSIKRFWNTQQQEVLSRVSGSNLILAGDRRCDSLGFSAKYCTYSLLDTAANLIIHMETLKRSDASVHSFCDQKSCKLEFHLLCHVDYKSPNMETQALRKGLRFLEDKISISKVVTDASRTVMSLMGEVFLLTVNINTVIILFSCQTCADKEFSNCLHSLDVWHKSKKLKKCLAEVSTCTCTCNMYVHMHVIYTCGLQFLQAAKGRGMEKIGLWAEKFETISGFVVRNVIKMKMI